MLVLAMCEVLHISVVLIIAAMVNSINCSLLCALFVLDRDALGRYCEDEKQPSP